MNTCRKRRSGAALVEFALVALLVYMIAAAAIEFGRAIFMAQTIQDAARVAARELALVPLPADYTFDCPAAAQAGECTNTTTAVNDSAVLGQVWNPNLLVIDIKNCYQLPGGGGLDGQALNTYIASLPPVNRALQPLFINEIVNVGGTEQHFLRYPGALLADTSPTAGSNPCPATYNPNEPSNPTTFTVGIPQVVSRDSSTGVETIRWVPVLEEVRPCPNDPITGPFSYDGSQTGQDPTKPCASPFQASPAAKGLASLRINYPFQSAALSGFRNQPAGVDSNGAPNPNLAYAIPADDAGVAVQGSSPDNTAPLDSECQDVNGVVTPCQTYSGPYGLGKQYAFGGTISTNGTVAPINAVRPYRNLLSGQATFRREVTR